MLLLLACAPVEPDPCEPSASPTLEIGEGTSDYSPMGAEIPLYHGPQGGYHLVLSFRATNLDDSGPAEGHLVGTVGGLPLADVVRFLNFRCDPTNGAEEAWGALLTYDALPEELDGQKTTIAATVTDASGTVATASVVVTIMDQP